MFPAQVRHSHISARVYVTCLLFIAYLEYPHRRREAPALDEPIRPQGIVVHFIIFLESITPLHSRSEPTVPQTQTELVSTNQPSIFASFRHLGASGASVLSQVYISFLLLSWDPVASRAFLALPCLPASHRMASSHLVPSRPKPCTHLDYITSLHTTRGLHITRPSPVSVTSFPSTPF